MFSHETARGTVGLTPNKYTYIFTSTLYSVLFEPRKTFLSRSGWLTYPSHIMPVQAFSIFIFSCLPERSIDVRIDQLLYKNTILSHLTIRSSHRCVWCGFEPCSGHM